MKKIKRFRYVNNVIIFLMLSSWMIVFGCYIRSMYSIYAVDSDFTYYLISTAVFSLAGVLVFATTVILIWINRLVHGWKKK